MLHKLSSKKDYIKLIRGILQGIILIGLVLLAIKALFTMNTYQPFNESNVEYNQQNTGFIAISYLGVNRTGSEQVMSTKRLEEHLEVLYKNGYVTITQQDIMDYYINGKDLPPKSLFLMFEDGYRGTAIFAQKIMEKYNFKATMLTYADKFDNEDPKFLTPKDLKSLEKSTFWEMGTNGYRLAYINVFDKNNQYLGELTSSEYTKVMKELDRRYNQYLMDYIRDENGIPKETYTQMKIRITTDYELLEQIYTKEMGYIPRLYVLMHANTGQFGNNQKVSEVNETNIKKFFDMNFNREGYALNDKSCNIYDLTRMQPQPYWYPNHLLMRVQDDTNSLVEFEQGDLERMKDWEHIKGATEHRGDVIALTSLSKDTGLIRLKQSENYQDYKLSTRLTGNIVGSQAIYLRADKELKNYIKVQLINNILYVYESIDGNEVVLDEVALTLPPNKEETRIQIHTRADRALELNLEGNRLKVQIDDEIRSVECTLTGPGFVYLESAWGEYGYSQRNLADDVYDGVFEELYIATIDTDETLYDNRYHGIEKIVKEVEKIWTNIVNWFIETL